MNLHSDARLTLWSRADLVEAVIQEGLTLKRAAARFRVSERTAAIRYQSEHPGDILHIDIKKLGRVVRPVTASPATSAITSQAPVGSSST